MDGESKEDRDLTRFKLRVLVADDTVFNQQIIKRLLNKWGVEGGGPHRLDSLRGRISYEPKAFGNRNRHQAASAKGWGRP